jgi:hypothetical protein
LNFILPSSSDAPTLTRKRYTARYTASKETVLVFLIQSWRK